MNLKLTTQSMLDCDCKGDGIITVGDKDYKCPIHFHCAFDEDYRLEVLRLEYQNMRHFLVHTFPLNSDKQVDSLLVRLYNPKKPEEWVRAVQDLVRTLLEE